MKGFIDQLLELHYSCLIVAFSNPIQSVSLLQTLRTFIKKTLIKKK